MDLDVLFKILCKSSNILVNTKGHLCPNYSKKGII